MSKMDNLRAMREARYEAAQKLAKNGPAKAAAPAAAPAKAAPKKAASKPKAASKSAEPPAGADALCGHRNMSGRTCTREQGHAAKSHRYS